MPSKLNILLLGQSAERLDVLEDMMVDEPDIHVSRRLLSRETQASLAGLLSQPDILLLDLGEDWQNELLGVCDSGPVQSRPPMIVLGGADDREIMRRAMQAGARDFFGDDVSDEELVTSVRRIGLEAQLSHKQSIGSLTVVVNGKGGAGTSFISSCLATVPMATKQYIGSSVALLDLDIQFGDLPVYFDMKCDDSLIQALSTVNELDPLALEGLMRTHQSGVRILAGRYEEIQDRARFGTNEVSSLLKLLTRVYDHVVVDLPRHFDAMTMAALEQADHVVVVTQQTVPHIRDTRFVISLLRNMGLPNKSINILVNRFDKGSEVRMPDIREVFEDFEIHTVPNDYKRALFCVDNGMPLLQKWPKSPISRSIVKLAEALWPEYARVNRKKPRTPLFRRAHA